MTFTEINAYFIIKSKKIPGYFLTSLAKSMLTDEVCSLIIHFNDYGKKSGTYIIMPEHGFREILLC